MEIKTYALIENATNKVHTLCAWDGGDSWGPPTGFRAEIYDSTIHPWGRVGFVDIEVGLDWRERYLAINPEADI